MFKIFLYIYAITILLNIILANLAFLRVKNNEKLKNYMLNKIKECKSHDNKAVLRIKLLVFVFVPILHLFNVLLCIMVILEDENNVIRLFERSN